MKKHSPIFLNFHGFMGAPDNKNGRALALLYPEALLLSPFIDYLTRSPKSVLSEADCLLETHFEEERPIILVGQSLGGFVAEALSRRHGLPCLLTNPCLLPQHCEVITSSPMPRPFLEEYEELGIKEGLQNPNAFTLCTKTDEVLGRENFDRCAALGGWLLEVKGRHSGIEKLNENLFCGIEEILKSIP
jgi:predicted esterase YcpF (UPF0227 family)